MNEREALIVEDNLMNSEILETLLLQHGITPTSVTLPKDIQAAASKLSNLAVIFLDLEFPNADGFQIHRELKATDWAKDIPVVAYTVHLGEMDRARREGFDGFIGKPVAPSHFEMLLKQILAGQAVWYL